MFKYRSYQFVAIILILFIERNNFHDVHENLYYDILCVAVTFGGILIRALTVGFVHEKTSGRNTKAQNAYELNTTGAYSLVRNPLYVGNFVVLFGISMLSYNYVVVLLNSITFIIINTFIILTEEDYLLGKFGDTYRDYASRVNCVIPSFSKFCRPARSLDLYMILKREHDSWLTAVVSLVCVEFFRDYYSNVPVIETGWLVFLGVGAAVWAVLKYMKKTGRLVLA
jgi:protein-S-isoprenylcysteine O-methyltransferase Ste14